MFKKIAVVLLLIFIGMQFFNRIEPNKEVDPAKDFIAITSPSTEIEEILRVSCYDCHSEQTKLPWYARIAPSNWYVKGHIEEGKEHLNFSLWGDYDAGKQDHKLEEFVEMMEDGKMPLKSYTNIHWDAKLNNEQIASLIDWAEELRSTYK